MKVQELMTRDVKSCGREASLAEAGKTMRDGNLGILPVLDTKHKISGLITDRDICIALSSRSVPATQLLVGDVIKGEVYSCKGDDDLREALHVMREHRIRRLPVVDGRGQLKGLLSLDDVAAAMGKSQGAPSAKDVAETLKAICLTRPDTGPRKVDA